MVASAGQGSGAGPSPRSPPQGLPVQPGEGQRWLCPTAGAPAGVAGGLPQWGRGRGTGGCPGGGWVAGGVFPRGVAGGPRPQGLSAPQPRATLAEDSAAFPFRGFCKDELSHPARGRCLHTAPGPALPAHSCSLADPTHLLESSCSYTHSHSPKPNAQCLEGKQAARALGHMGLEIGPHGHFQVLEQQGQSQPCRRGPRFGAAGPAAGPSGIWSHQYCGLQINGMGWSRCCQSGGSEQCRCVISVRTVSWG